jgi:phosphatidylinositol glycan class O
MPQLHLALAARPRHARLYRATADAPTVTMQRVKALATGGLPTFMDIGASFGSGRVGEDSWLAQAAAKSNAAAGGRGGGLHLIGDDTWEALFPHVWTRAPSGAPLRHAPFSTFDTQDLDSGDARIAAELLPALEALSSGGAGNGTQHPPPSWRVLLAHAPGVDHVGHTHGAHHAAMARKLGEADALVAAAAAALARAPGRSLLVVAGDHGMTEDGNHGGASLQEAGAALLAVSFGRPLLAPGAVGAEAAGAAPSLEGQVHDVSQLDLVPSIALALGLPIPYNSLGSAFADWEWGGARGAAHASLLVAFAQQRFMTAYSRAVEGSSSSGGSSSDSSSKGGLAWEGGAGSA